MGGSNLSYIPYNRRRFIKTCMSAAAGLFFFSAPVNGSPGKPTRERRLQFYNIHTRERLQICYWANGNYHGDALDAINHFFRDFRTGDVKTIDVRLLDLLHDVCETVPGGNTLHLISGYRSPETNRMLSSISSGVSIKSLHMLGQAADIRLPGVRTAKLRDIAASLGVGGVGYYPESDFVHVDIGHVRCW